MTDLGAKPIQFPDGQPVVSIVVPCYLEEQALPRTIDLLTAFRSSCVAEGLISARSEIIFVDDGSTDGTWALIADAHLRNPAVKGLRLSSNSGHQNALMAGLEEAKGDFVISIDADLQDDIEVMRDMIRDASRGVDIVFGVRKRRATDSFLKRFSAEGFYRLMRLFGVDLVFNHADFRGLSRRALTALLRYQEKSLFLRGLVRKLGFRTSEVYYDRLERTAGETKYPFRKMLGLAIYGLTSFSFVPLRMVLVLGVGLFALALVLIAWVFWVKYFTDTAVPGWTSMLGILTFFSSMQLLCLGIIGEYLAVIFVEVKNRPRFHIAERTEDDAAARS